MRPRDGGTSSKKHDSLLKQVAWIRGVFKKGDAPELASVEDLICIRKALGQRVKA
ncbi:MAG: hypothetical protein PVJ24_01515 [Methyloceanibacter sp.]